MQRYTDLTSLIAACGHDGSLVDADMTFAHLEGIDLSGLDLSGVNFSGGSLTDVILDGCLLDHMHAIECRMTRVSFKHARLGHALFQKSVMEAVTFAGADLTAGSFLISELPDADFRNARLIRTQFLQCNLERVDFTGADLSRGSLRESSLEGTRFVSTDLRETDFRKTNLHHAHYHHVCADGALFYGKPPWEGEAILGRDWHLELVVFDGE
ncbi:MAG: pentapeptide repeat-containing protein [Magnetococcales bacterium]|nr:pentapeptide repeat-containing protein [Magnetococcales bacterium]